MSTSWEVLSLLHDATNANAGQTHPHVAVFFVGSVKDGPTVTEHAAMLNYSLT